ncbi:MAG: hypothetical protein ACOX8A_11080 [Thermacetogeniaceae bacterium]|jgi:hypothetical protein
MKRTKGTNETSYNEKKKVAIPDLVYKGVRQGNFTIIPNDILRDPNISSKAKVLLFIGLSNQDGWKSHKTTICSMMKEGENAIDSAIKELQRFGLMKKVRYRDQQTKQVKGSFWMYTDTPYVFSSLNDVSEILGEVGMEIFPSDLEGITVNGSDTEENSNPSESHKDGTYRDGTYRDGTYRDGTYRDRNMALKILSKNIKDKNIILFSDLNLKESKQDKNSRYVPLAEKLASIIKKNKRINVTSQRIASWANEIRKLVETDGVSIQRVETALDWYEDNIGGQYIPVIESGSSLRSKFIKLEDAMRRAGAVPGQSKTSPTDTPKDPKKVLRRFFRSKDLANVFYRDCYEPAEVLFEGTVDEGTLAEILLNLYSQIKEKQEQHLKGDLVRLLPGPMELIARYIDWIRDNTWITDIRLDMFDLNHSLFSRFRRDEAKTDNFERDAITGKSYLRG